MEVAEIIQKVQNIESPHKPITVHSYINGKARKNSKTWERENPADPQEIVGYYPENSLEECQEAIDAAYESFPSWGNTSLEKRKERLGRAVDKLEKRIPELTRLMTREHGKALADSSNELIFAVTICKYALKVIDEILEEEVIMDNEKGLLKVIKQPVGVVGAISPWNYPIDLCVNKIVPALITGNTVVVKPSPYAPLAVTEVMNLFAEEMPPGVVNIVHGPAEIGAELTSNPKISKIAFTGGTATAKHIIKAASDTIKKMTLELGGNDAAIILKDADLSKESMTRLVIGSFLTGGQICMAAKRIYVHKSIYQEFLSAYKEAANEWIKIDNGLNETATVGPVNNKRQKDFVSELVEDAKNRGATVVPLGQIIDRESFNKGYFLQPTLVTEVQQDFRIVKEEQFGPTVPVVTFESEEEAIKLANDSIFGLASSVWSSDIERAISLASKIRAGYTFINTHSIPGVDIRSPFGGFKQSGIGREYGKEGFLDYLELHTISYPTSGAVPASAF